ncbi:O-antigen ligase family protein [Arthrobacter sp. UYEF21]|uniref:O-antigen ligase family protein n=1 Tax=Arthrobacter sp. UYEF21 TaxID=1756364 RepID=UPI0033919A21
MQNFLILLIAGSSIVPLISNVRRLHQSLAGRGELSSVFGVAIVVLGGLLYEARLVPTGQPAQIAVFGLLLGSVVLQVSRSLSLQTSQAKAAVSVGLFLPAIISAAMFLVNALQNVELPLGQSLGRLLAVAILFLIAVCVAASRLDLKDICRIITISVLVIFLLSSFGHDGWRACDIFKCGPFGAIYTGPFASENALAIFVCVAILCTFASWTGKGSAWTLVPLGLTLYATESRTSQLALAGSLTIWVIVVLWKKAARPVGMDLDVHLRKKAKFIVITILAVFIASFYLLLHAEPASFSNRGNVWIRGLMALGGDWWIGLGLDRWTFLQSIGVVPLLFPHSQYLLLLFGGGVAAVALLFLLFSVATWAASKGSASLGFGAAYIVFLSILGLTEAYWNPMAFDGHTFLVIPLVFLISITKDPSTISPDSNLATRAPRAW